MIFKSVFISEINKKIDQMIMMSTLNAERGLRTSSPLSKPRAVYSIDQILGNHRRNSVNGEKFYSIWKLS